MCSISSPGNATAPLALMEPFFTNNQPMHPKECATTAIMLLRPGSVEVVLCAITIQHLRVSSSYEDAPQYLHGTET